MPFIFKLAANLLLEFGCSHVYSQHEVVNDCKSTVPFKFLQLMKMHFNSHMGLDLCFKLINGSPIWYASFTNEIFGQLLCSYNRYAGNLNMKAVSFTHLVERILIVSEMSQRQSPFSWPAFENLKPHKYHYRDVNISQIADAHWLALKNYILVQNTSLLLVVS